MGKSTRYFSFFFESCSKIFEKLPHFPKPVISASQSYISTIITLMILANELCTKALHFRPAKILYVQLPVSRGWDFIVTPIVSWSHQCQVSEHESRIISSLYSQTMCIMSRSLSAEGPKTYRFF